MQILQASSQMVLWAWRFPHWLPYPLSPPCWLVLSKPQRGPSFRFTFSRPTQNHGLNSSSVGTPGLPLLAHGGNTLPFTRAITASTTTDGYCGASSAGCVVQCHCTGGDVSSTPSPAIVDTGALFLLPQDHFEQLVSNFRAIDPEWNMCIQR